jgi:hypothetical protein
MNLNINCIYNYRGRICKNKNVKKSLLFNGKRKCIIFPGWNEKCKYKITYSAKNKKN